jgi:hypothetical protein
MDTRIDLRVQTHLRFSRRRALITLKWQLFNDATAIATSAARGKGMLLRLGRQEVVLQQFRRTPFSQRESDYTPRGKYGDVFGPSQVTRSVSEGLHYRPRSRFGLPSKRPTCGIVTTNVSHRAGNIDVVVSCSSQRLLQMKP